MKKLIFIFCLGFCTLSIAKAQDTPPKDTTTQQQDYVGSYKFPDGSPVAEVKVVVDNGAISMESSAGVSPLEKLGEDLYTITQFQVTAKFNRDSNKKVIGVSINAMGYVLEGTKSNPIAFIQRITPSKIIDRVVK